MCFLLFVAPQIYRHLEVVNVSFSLFSFLSAPLQDFPEKNQGAASSSKTPLLLLSPPETCRGDDSTFPIKSPQGTFSRRNALRRCRPGLLQTDSHSPPKHTEKERKSDKSERNQNIFFSSEKEPKSPGGGNLLLPRSSPVLSRRPRPLSWHGRRSPPADPSRYKKPFTFTCRSAFPSGTFHVNTSIGIGKHAL